MLYLEPGILKALILLNIEIHIVLKSKKKDDKTIFKNELNICFNIKNCIESFLILNCSSYRTVILNRTFKNIVEHINRLNTDFNNIFDNTRISST